MEFNHGKRFSAEKYKSMFLERDVWASYAQLAFSKKNKGIQEEVTETEARKMVADIAKALLLLIGSIIFLIFWWYLF